MKRNERTEKFKAYLRKENELNENWAVQRALGYKPLDKPIHDGYNGEWKLRADIARSKYGEDVENLIYHFGKSVWCRDKSFTRYDYKQKREVDIKPYFKLIDEGTYERLLPWCKRFFVYTPSEDRVYWGSVKKFYKVNLPEYYFKLKKSKHYKTHYKVIDEVLKQEEAEIDAALETTFFKENKKHKWGRGPSKDLVQLYNRADRHHNKQALKKNMSMMFAKYDDIDDDWGCWTSDYCDDFVEFRYNHKHSCLWDWW
jgi:hypothetical protein